MLKIWKFEIKYLSLHLELGSWLRTLESCLYLLLILK